MVWVCRVGLGGKLRASSYHLDRFRRRPGLQRETYVSIVAKGREAGNERRRWAWEDRIRTRPPTKLAESSFSMAAGGCDERGGSVVEVAMAGGREILDEGKPKPWKKVYDDRVGDRHNEWPREGSGRYMDAKHQNAPAWKRAQKLVVEGGQGSTRLGCRMCQVVLGSRLMKDIKVVNSTYVTSRMLAASLPVHFGPTRCAIPALRFARACWRVRVSVPLNIAREGGYLHVYLYLHVACTYPPRTWPERAGVKRERRRVHIASAQLMRASYTSS